jgi:hypothetical protein
VPLRPPGLRGILCRRWIAVGVEDVDPRQKASLQEGVPEVDAGVEQGDAAKPFSTLT